MANVNAAPAVQPAKKGKPDYIVIIGLSLALLAVGYWNYATFVSGPSSADTDSADCIPIKGLVRDIHASSGSKKSRETYHLTFTYQVEGKQYESKEQVTSNIYDRVQEGDSIEICYMKGHPDRAGVIGNDINGENAFLVVLVDIGVLVVIGMLIVAGIRKRKKAA